MGSGGRAPGPPPGSPAPPLSLTIVWLCGDHVPLLEPPPLVPPVPSEWFLTNLSSLRAVRWGKGPSALSHPPRAPAVPLWQGPPRFGSQQWCCGGTLHFITPFFPQIPLHQGDPILAPAVAPILLQGDTQTPHSGPLCVPPQSPFHWEDSHFGSPSPAGGEDPSHSTSPPPWDLAGAGFGS